MIMPPDLNFEAESFAGYNPSQDEEYGPFTEYGRSPGSHRWGFHDRSRRWPWLQTGSSFEVPFQESEADLLFESGSAGSARDRALVTEQIGRGVRDENKLTDAVFFQRHPDWKGKALKNASRALRAEWVQIRDALVRPLLKSAPPSAKPVAPPTPVPLPPPAPPTPPVQPARPTLPSARPGAGILGYNSFDNIRQYRPAQYPYAMAAQKAFQKVKGFLPYYRRIMNAVRTVSIGLDSHGIGNLVFYMDKRGFAEMVQSNELLHKARGNDRQRIARPTGIYRRFHRSRRTWSDAGRDRSRNRERANGGRRRPAVRQMAIRPSVQVRHRPSGRRSEQAEPERQLFRLSKCARSRERNHGRPGGVQASLLRIRRLSPARGSIGADRSGPRNSSRRLPEAAGHASADRNGSGNGCPFCKVPRHVCKEDSMRPEINFEAESFAGYNPSEGEEPEQFAKSWGGGGWGGGGWGRVGEVEAWDVADRASGDHVGHIVGDIDAGRGCYGGGSGFGFGDSMQDGQSVAWAQGCLSQITGNMVPQSGHLDSATRSAISMFQMQQQLPATGALDDQTMQALQAACAQGGTQESETPTVTPKSSTLVLWFELNSTRLRQESEADSAIHLALVIKESLQHLKARGDAARIILHGYASREGAEDAQPAAGRSARRPCEGHAGDRRRARNPHSSRQPWTKQRLARPEVELARGSRVSTSTIAIAPRHPRWLALVR